jgi:hypothetical protein
MDGVGELEELAAAKPAKFARGVELEGRNGQFGGEGAEAGFLTGFGEGVEEGEMGGSVLEGLEGLGDAVGVGEEGEAGIEVHMSPGRPSIYR